MYKQIFLVNVSFGCRENGGKENSKKNLDSRFYYFGCRNEENFNCKIIFIYYYFFFVAEKTKYREKRLKAIIFYLVLLDFLGNYPEVLVVFYYNSDWWFAQDLTARNFFASFGFNKTTAFKGNRLLVGRPFKLNCSVDREMDVSTSVLVDGVAECLNGMCGCHIQVVKMYSFVNSVQIYGFSSYLWWLIVLLVAELEVKEPSISTMVLNFENKFDPYEAVSTPIYQTATFKQVILKKFLLFVNLFVSTFWYSRETVMSFTQSRG